MILVNLRTGRGTFHALSDMGAWRVQIAACLRFWLSAPPANDERIDDGRPAA